jgi:hypothetical protein
MKKSSVYFALLSLAAILLFLSSCGEGQIIEVKDIGGLGDSEKSLEELVQSCKNDPSLPNCNSPSSVSTGDDSSDSNGSGTSSEGGGQSSSSSANNGGTSSSTPSSSSQGNGGGVCTKSKNVGTETTCTSIGSNFQDHPDSYNHGTECNCSGGLNIYQVENNFGCYTYPANKDHVPPPEGAVYCNYESLFKQ